MTTNAEERAGGERPGGITLARGTVADLATIAPHMARDFPATGKSAARLADLLAGGEYALYLARRVSPADGGIAPIDAFAFVYAAPEAGLLWLDYLAVEPGLRGHGIGSRVVRALLAASPDVAGMLIEVDSADVDDPQERSENERRIAFYERLGAIRTPVAYRFPTPDGSLPMHLYVLPAPGVAFIAGEAIAAATRATFAAIHADIPHRDAVFASFIAGVRDVTM